MGKFRPRNSRSKSDETGANLGEKAQDVEAQDETPLEEAQDAAQLQGKEQDEEAFDDGLP